MPRPLASSLTRRALFRAGGATLLSGILHGQSRAKPNIVFIYADDIGYGDVGCYGAKFVRTPNVDRLAGRGVRFTDAHSTAATCTPSRYSLLTGEYAFRQKEARVLPGDAPLLIPPGTPTLPSLLRTAGYRTGVVGKWHLGLGSGSVNWNADISPGPLDIGFDYNFIIPATGDRVPCVYVENRRVVGLDPKDPIQVSYQKPIGNEPTGKTRPDLLRMHPSHGHDMAIVNGISRIGYMTGGTSGLWKDEDMADVITAKAKSFVDGNRSQPFFLHFNTHDIHVPRAPHPRFSGATTMGPRGSALASFDWSVGEIVAALERHNLLDNTLIVLSSDNGPVVDDGYHDQAVEKLGDHRPAGPLRGGKYSAFEAGTRVPFLVHWPARVKPGVSDALVSQVDLAASLASLAGVPLPENAAGDSFNLLPAFLGESGKGRDHLIEQAGTLALRHGSWKYIEPSKGPRFNANVSIELGNDPGPQLYDLAKDPGERNNLAAAQPERVAEMKTQLAKLRNSPRTRL